MSHRGKVALITGASSGIGARIAEDLAAQGAKVHVCGRDARRLAEVAARCPGSSTLAFDLDAPPALELDALDYLVHAAGVVTLGPLATAPIEDLDLNYRVNLRGPLRLTQLALPALRRAQGQIVFVNSGAGLSARGGWGHYAASKHGLKAIAESLREELGPTVRVISVFPGRTATPMQERVRALEGAAYEPERYLAATDVSRMVLEALAVPRSAKLIDVIVRP